MLSFVCSTLGKNFDNKHIKDSWISFGWIFLSQDGVSERVPC